ncbi:E3 ubiquitin-protein ligase RFI2 [Eutrema salsugineum]|uniref:E3 ubiquitin-protein ligase RFI2 n=1 Tax=Eutrema salsugineum TaxID=72664 RepID=UPI000CECF37F|nr:E3 ubiquitin-protein ligase RFI2 [Eutrema salsugineum]
MSLESNEMNGCKQFSFDLNAKPVDDGNCDSPKNSDSCSICLETLVKTSDDNRTLVTLKCDHKFHLDCIGLAFNAKKLMQCPNCRQIEPGQWRDPTNPPIPTAGEDDINITMEMELCPLQGLGQQDSFENPHLLGQQCQYIEYSFTIPQSSATVSVPQNFIFSSHWITSTGQVHYHMPSNRMIFWSASEPGVIRGRHYLAHPFYDHRFNSSAVVPPNLDGSSIANASPSLISSTMHLNQLPFLFGQTANPEQTARGISYSRATSSGSNQANSNGLSRSNVWAAENFFDLEEQFAMERELYFVIYGSRGGGPRGGGSSSNGGRAGGENGDGNGISGRN